MLKVNPPDWPWFAMLLLPWVDEVHRNPCSGPCFVEPPLAWVGNMNLHAALPLAWVEVKAFVQNANPHGGPWFGLLLPWVGDVEAERESACNIAIGLGC